MAKDGGIVSSIDHEFEAKPQQQAHKKGFSGQRNGSTEGFYINQDAEGCAKNDAQNHPVGVLENEIAGPQREWDQCDEPKLEGHSSCHKPDKAER